jgi:hypothetical protein
MGHELSHAFDDRKNDYYNRYFTINSRLKKFLMLAIINLIDRCKLTIDLNNSELKNYETYRFKQCLFLKRVSIVYFLKHYLQFE